MTTSDILTLAGSGGLGSPDLDLEMVLRQIVVPKFLLDVDQEVGDTYWRRKTTTISVTSSAQDYDLPTDFDHAKAIQPYDSENIEYDGLKYVGEDPRQVIIADSATSSNVGRPTGYYIITGSSAPFAIRLNTYPDTSYTLHVLYYWRFNFANNATEVDLDSYIPVQFQGSLVHLMRSQIYADRYGAGDKRADVEERKYNEWLARLVTKKEAGARNYASFVN